MHRDQHNGRKIPMFVISGANTEEQLHTFEEKMLLAFEEDDWTPFFSESQHFIM